MRMCVVVFVHLLLLFSLLFSSFAFRRLERSARAHYAIADVNAYMRLVDIAQACAERYNFFSWVLLVKKKRISIV